jgi:hypothetical protein
MGDTKKIIEPVASPVAQPAPGPDEPRRIELASWALRNPIARLFVSAEGQPEQPSRTDYRKAGFAGGFLGFVFPGRNLRGRGRGTTDAALPRRFGPRRVRETCGGRRSALSPEGRGA